MQEDITEQAERGSATPTADAIIGPRTGREFPGRAALAARPPSRAPARDLIWLRAVDRRSSATAAPGDRLAKALDWLEDELRAAYAGTPEHELMSRLAATIAACDLPPEPFLRLIEANRSDQHVRSYERWSDLMDYCALSANPVGELVLRVFGLASPERIRQSDAVCSALQVIEHCQDIREDLARGRVYLPLEDLALHCCNLEDIEAASVSPGLRDVLALECTRASALLDEGAPLVRSLRGWPRVAIAGYVGGGRAALSALARANFEVLALTPRPSLRHRVGSILRALEGTQR